MDPSGIAALIRRGGSQVTTVFIGTLVLTVGIGVALPSAVFVMTEDS
jgi:hypothetical protein